MRNRRMMAMDMKEESSDYQNAQSQRPREHTSLPSEMRIADAGKDVNFGLRRLEWIAVFLFGVNLILMLYSMSIYSGDKTWAYFATGIGTATAVVLLLSLLFSIFSRSAYSRLALAAAIVGTMISIVSLGIRMMKEISDWGIYHYY